MCPVWSCRCLQMEVVKTRMQLQGELVLRENASSVAATSNDGKTGGGQRQAGYRRPYRNAFDAFYKICRDEGFRGIQAGLLPGLMYQVHIIYFCFVLCTYFDGACCHIPQFLSKLMRSDGRVPILSTKTRAAG